MPFRRPNFSFASFLALCFLAVVPLGLFWPALFDGKMIYGYDTLALGVPYWAAIQRSLAAHEWPLWIPGLYGGMPGIAASNMLFTYPTSFVGNLLGLSLRSIDAWTCVLLVALSGLGMFLFLRRLNRSVSASLLGAFMFAVSGSQVSQVYGGYMNFVEGIAMVPWAFWAVHKGGQERSWAAWGLCGLAFGLQILSVSVQIFVYTYAAVAVFAFSRAVAGEPAAALPWRPRWALKGPALGGLAVAAVLAFLLSAPQLWLNMQYLTLTARHGATQAWVTNDSIRLSEALTWLVPGLYGWKGALSQSFTSEYFGLLPWALAAAALAAGWRREPMVRWMLGLAVVALFFAQRHWTPYFYVTSHIPGVEGFRIWSRILFLATFGVCSLAAFGWDALRAADSVKAASRGAAVYIGLAAALAGSVWVFRGVRGEDADLAGASARATLVLLPFLSLVILAGAKNAKLGLVLAFALGFHAFDQSQVTHRFIRFIEPAAAIPMLKHALPPPAGPGEEPWRIMDLHDYFNNTAVYWGHESLNGQASMPPASTLRIQEALRQRGLLYLDLFNVRYVFVKGKPGDPSLRLVENKGAYPRAWLVTQSRSVTDDEKAYEMLADPAFDPRREVALLGGPALAGSPSKGRVAWVDRSPLRSTLEVEADQDSVLVLSNNWYPSWRCRVDGQAAPLFKADGGLQAVALKAGRHQVTIRFDTTFFYQAMAAAMAGLVAVVGLLFYKASLDPS